MPLWDFQLFNKFLEKYDLGLKFQVVGIHFVRELLRIEKLFKCCWKYQLPAYMSLQNQDSTNDLLDARAQI